MIPFERLFSDIKRPLTYEINLSAIKEFDQFRERHLLIGNRSILDLVQITYVEHQEQAIVLGYRLNTAINEESTIHFVNCWIEQRQAERVLLTDDRSEGLLVLSVSRINLSTADTCQKKRMDEGVNVIGLV
jgi:hypothetical protein